MKFVRCTFSDYSIKLLAPPTFSSVFFQETDLNDQRKPASSPRLNFNLFSSLAFRIW